MSEYDTVIVGAGSAGCVLAGRLAEDTTRRILVLEAGGSDRSWLVRVPLGVGKVWRDPAFNWSYQSEPEPHVDERSIYHPRGKVIGGSSSINMMAYVRGHRGDYDRWASMGHDGWSYEDVLPYFKRAESYAGGDDAYRGRNGPLQVTLGSQDEYIYDDFLTAGEELGYAPNKDYNGATQDGFARLQFTIGNGQRCSAADAYLRPALRTGRVDLISGVHVSRVILQKNHAVGVEYLKDGKKVEVRTDGEVIVAGGAINSPQILMLSGIGPAQHLRSLGIAPRVDLPGVGRNLQDHPAVTIAFANARPSRLNRELRLDRLALSMAQARLMGSGYATQPPAGMTAFIRSSPDEPIPDLQLFCRNGSVMAREWFPGLRRPAPDEITLRACHLHPESRGMIRLGSTDPTAAPLILNNFLATDGDRRALRESIRFMTAMAMSKAFKDITKGFARPDHELRTDDEIDAYIRSVLDTVYHPIGTCRMGTDDLAVVDPSFRVHGVANLRVIDASAMPDLVGGNINAAVIMLAEKASDIVRGNKAPVPEPAAT